MINPNIDRRHLSVIDAIRSNVKAVQKYDIPVDWSNKGFGENIPTVTHKEKRYNLTGYTDVEQLMQEFQKDQTERLIAEACKQLRAEMEVTNGS